MKRGYAVADSRFVVNYYRTTVDHRLLFGGGENYSYRFPRRHRAIRAPAPPRGFPAACKACGSTMPGAERWRSRRRACRSFARSPRGFTTPAGSPGLESCSRPTPARSCADAIAGERDGIRGVCRGAGTALSRAARRCAGRRWLLRCRSTRCATGYDSGVNLCGEHPYMTGAHSCAAAIDGMAGVSRGRIRSLQRA